MLDVDILKEATSADLLPRGRPTSEESLAEFRGRHAQLVA